MLLTTTSSVIVTFLISDKMMRPLGILFSFCSTAVLLSVPHDGSMIDSPDAQRESAYGKAILIHHLPDTLSFCGEPVPLQYQDVRERMEREFYTTLHGDAQIVLLLKQAGRVFPLLEERLHQAGLPDDIKYLVVAESGLRNVVSAKGAAGLWQFTEDAARGVGLEVNYWIDERFNLEKTTSAAMKFLRDLYDRFRSWTLAAAAYNAGPENITDNVKFQWEGDYYRLFLNEETSRYIFRIVALKEILSHPVQYGFILGKGEVYEPYDVKQVEVNAPIPNLALWAKEHGTSYRDIKMLNPWILKRKLPYGQYVITVPRAANPQQIDLSKYDYGEVKYQDEPSNSLRR